MRKVRAVSSVGLAVLVIISAGLVMGCVMYPPYPPDDSAAWQRLSPEMQQSWEEYYQRRQQAWEEYRQRQQQALEDYQRWSEEYYEKYGRYPPPPAPPGYYVRPYPGYYYRPVPVYPYRYRNPYFPY